MSTTEYQYSIGLCQFTARLRGGRTLDKPVLEFKQGFDGHAEELVGACTLPTSTIRYKLVEAVHAIKPLKKAGR